MTLQEEKQFEKAVAAYRKKVTTSAQEARKALAKSGIYNTDGSLTREYSDAE